MSTSTIITTTQPRPAAPSDLVYLQELRDVLEDIELRLTYWLAQKTDILRRLAEAEGQG